MAWGPLRAALLCAAAAALLGVPAAHAAVTVTETPVQIPASMPDDSGAPVILDGGIDVPSEGLPMPPASSSPRLPRQTGTTAGGLARELAAHGYVVLRYKLARLRQTRPARSTSWAPKERQDLLDAVHWLNARGDVIHNDIGQYGASYGGGAHAWWLAQSGDPRRAHGDPDRDMDRHLRRADAQRRRACCSTSTASMRRG